MVVAYRASRRSPLTEPIARSTTRTDTRMTAKPSNCRNERTLVSPATTRPSHAKPARTADMTAMLRRPPRRIASRASGLGWATIGRRPRRSFTTRLATTSRSDGLADESDRTRSLGLGGSYLRSRTVARSHDHAQGARCDRRATCPNASSVGTIVRSPAQVRGDLSADGGERRTPTRRDRSPRVLSSRHDHAEPGRFQSGQRRRATPRCVYSICLY